MSKMFQELGQEDDPEIYLIQGLFEASQLEVSCSAATFERPCLKMSLRGFNSSKLRCRKSKVGSNSVHIQPYPSLNPFESLSFLNSIVTICHYTIVIACHYQNQ